jgi:uncharacterized membrane protein
MTISMPMKVLLAGSLALNAMVVGAIAAGAYGGLRVVGPGNAANPTRPFLGNPERNLSPALKKAVQEGRTSLRERMGAERPKLEAVRDAREALRTVLADPKATREQISAALSDVRARSVQVQALSDEVIVDILAKAEPKDRQALAMALMNRGRGGGAGDGKIGDRIRERLREGGPPTGDMPPPP